MKVVKKGRKFNFNFSDPGLQNIIKESKNLRSGASNKEISKMKRSKRSLKFEKVDCLKQPGL